MHTIRSGTQCKERSSHVDLRASGKCFSYLSDDGFMLLHAVVFLLDADVVQQ